jgi:hypothetical protein
VNLPEGSSIIRCIAVFPRHQSADWRFTNHYGSSRQGPDAHRSQLSKPVRLPHCLIKINDIGVLNQEEIVIGPLPVVSPATFLSPFENAPGPQHLFVAGTFLRHSTYAAVTCLNLGHMLAAALLIARDAQMHSGGGSRRRLLSKRG